MNAVFFAHDSIVDARADARLCLRCGAGAALRLLARLDYRVFVLCLAGAPAPARDAHAHAQGAADRLDDLLFREHVELSGYYADALHDGAAGMALAQADADAGPSLALRAAHEHGVALASSWLVGSTLRAIEAGNRAGCRSVLIDDGRERAWRLGKHRVPHRVVGDVYAAAILIANAGD